MNKLSLAALVAVVFLLGSSQAMGAHSGFLVISEGDITPKPKEEELDLEMTLTGTYGFSREGSSWNSLELEALLPLGSLDLSGALHYGSYERSVSLGTGVYLGVLSLSGDLKWIFFPSKDTIARLRAGVNLAPLSLSGSTAYHLTSSTFDDPNVGATLQLGSLVLSAGSVYDVTSGSIENPHAGVNLRMGALGLSATASDVSGSYTGGLGADFSLGRVSLGATAGLDMDGLGEDITVASKSLVLMYYGEAFNLSSTILHDNSTGLGVDSTLSYSLEKMTLEGTVRFDEDSFSVDTGVERDVGIGDLLLTLGFDKEGFKWGEFGIRASF